MFTEQELRLPNKISCVAREACGRIEAPVPNQSDAGSTFLEQKDKNELQKIC